MNAGSIPPAPADPFEGAIVCYAVDDTEHPTDRNDLGGEATLERIVLTPRHLEVSKYNAVGLPAVEGMNNGDNLLVFGGAGLRWRIRPRRSIPEIKLASG